MKSKLRTTAIIIFLVIAYCGSYYFLRSDEKLFFYKEVEYYHGRGSPAVHYSIASQTSYLHYFYYFPALIEKPFSWRSAHISEREGGNHINNLGEVRLSNFWLFVVLAITGYYGYKKYKQRARKGS